MAKCICSIRGDNGKITGVLRLSQTSEDAPTIVQGEIKGLTPGNHAISVNVYGDLSDNAISCGAIFNPFGESQMIDWILNFDFDVV